ncbi:hypothetical protein LTR84_004417 [Exophiala bonariae]|uniref:NACHT domain-containing protein n=1 Tax=Exophiala bonariae TaxID=1690606 RepID=A0AAV9N4T0_9EURO|nr:hypothetical protein LTR84_004417 [Exophiala bonariae]
MAEVAGLALAGNIIQFVDFAIKLFKEGQELYSSAEGVSTEALELGSITQAVKQYAQVLHASSSVKNTSRGGLADITHQCEALADELLSLLEELRVKDNQSRKWATFKVAVTSIRKSRTIADLEKRLSRMQALMSQFVISDLRQQQSILRSDIRLLRQQNDALEANTVSKLDDIVSRLSSQAEDKSSPAVTLGLTALADTSEVVIRKQRVLRRLHFGSIRVRYDTVKLAHAETFKWIFENSHSNFRDWLQSGDGVYWISGKAGSGKSTLTKWLLNPDGGRDSTLSNLQAWATTKKLNVGFHFFWNSGSSLQKSEEGLLRSILFQLFKDVPAFMEEIWLPLDEFDDDWNLERFRTAIRRLSQSQLLEDRICIFIDGLDEYSGDHQDLISIIQNLASNPSIKVCASSRPWNAFISAFAKSVNKIKLEDLTRDDIKKYVTTNLAEDINFKERESLEPLLKTIADDVTARAQGVFLWVHLVVQSLKKGLIDGARLPEMKALLDSLPSDLEQYFQHMIESIEPQYRQESVRIFKVATVARQPLPLVAYEFIEREQSDPEYALRGPVKLYSEDEIENIHHMMRKRLNAHCKDLLEVVQDKATSLPPLWCYTVDFLHRTVQEFFRKTDCTFETFGKWKPDDFDAELSLLRLSVASEKASPPAKEYQNVHPWGHTISDVLDTDFFVNACKYYALAIEDQCAQESGQKERLKQEFTLLDEMENVLVSKHGIDSKFEVDYCYRSELVDRNDYLLGSMIGAGLMRYVAYRLEDPHINERIARPLLGYALPMENNLNPSMVKLLLQRGANPNERFFPDTRLSREASVWAEYLGNLPTKYIESSRNEASASFLPVLRLLLEHGADLDELQWVLRPANNYGRGHLKQIVESSEIVELLESLKASRRNDKSVLKRFTNKAKLLLKGTKK